MLQCVLAILRVAHRVSVIDCRIASLVLRLTRVKKAIITSMP
jgi:hypothetical protein